MIRCIHIIQYSPVQREASKSQECTSLALEGRTACLCKRKGCPIAWSRITVWQVLSAHAFGPEVATTVYTVLVNQWMMKAMLSRLRVGSPPLSCVKVEGVAFDVDELSLLL